MPSATSAVHSVFSKHHAGVMPGVAECQSSLFKLSARIEGTDFVPWTVCRPARERLLWRNSLLRPLRFAAPTHPPTSPVRHPQSSILALVCPCGRPGFPHSATLPLLDSPPPRRQVLECARASAAFPLPPVARIRSCRVTTQGSVARCHRSLQNQPAGVESKPATPRCSIHIRFLNASKGLFNDLKPVLPKESIPPTSPFQ